MTPDQANLRDQALRNFYSAERRKGTRPLEANELMAEFAKRFDEMFSKSDAADLAVIRECIEGGKS